MSRSVSPLLLSSDDEVDAFAVDDEGEALLRMRPAASAYIDELADEEGLVFRSLGAGCSLDAEDASPTDYSTGVQGQQTHDAAEYSEVEYSDDDDYDVDDWEAVGLWPVLAGQAAEDAPGGEGSAERKDDTARPREAQRTKEQWDSWIDKRFQWMKALLEHLADDGLKGAQRAYLTQDGHHSAQTQLQQIIAFLKAQNERDPRSLEQRWLRSRIERASPMFWATLYALGGIPTRTSQIESRRLPALFHGLHTWPVPAPWTGWRRTSRRARRMGGWRTARRGAVIGAWT